jgi:putative transposase
MKIKEQSWCKHGLSLTQKFRRNEYKHLTKTTQEHKTCSNILNRNFAQEPSKALLRHYVFIFGEPIKGIIDGTTRENYLILCLLSLEWTLYIKH